MKTFVLIKKIILVVGLFALFALTAFAQDEVHKSFALNANGTISVMNISGPIRISGWGENRVQVDAVKRGNSADFAQVEIRITDTPDKLEINTIYPRINRRNSTNVWVEYELKVPRAAVLNSITSTSGDIAITNAGSRVTARSTSGEVVVRGTTGDTNVGSTSGNVAAEHIGGALMIVSTSGDMRIQDVNGRVSAQSTSGDVLVIDVRDEAAITATSGDLRIEKIGGRVNARAVSGKVAVKDVSGDATLESISDAVVAENIKGRVTITAVSADVTLRNVQEGVRVNAVSGTISITQTKGLVEARTTSGDITLRDVDSHDIQLNSHSGQVNYFGTIYEDGRYSFESFSGGILISIPANTNFTVNAKTYSGSIETDFSLQIAPGTITGNRPKRMQGTHGKEGGAQITASGFSADIQLKKRVEK